ncbi:MAG: hydrolase [Pirellulales bacterium]|nr:hydrolase [Planctomycetales bacterium]
MNDRAPLPRSYELLSRDDTALLVVDVQSKLVRAIRGHQRMVWNIRRLIDAARVFDVPIAATEQYPQGLGHTEPELRDRLGEIAEKSTFSCGSCSEIFTDLGNRNVEKILVTGIEAHVCVQQTSLDLLAAGFGVYIAVDAVGSRYQVDYDTALRRLESSGATLTTTESAMFEWCEASGTPQFKQISALVKETPPSEDD